MSMGKPVASSLKPVARRIRRFLLLQATSHRPQAGFTLVEMIVAVALFAVVMLVAVGALLSLTGANRKAQALQSVMNNLNIALDGMVRNIRMGTDYHCGAGTAPPQNCVNGDTSFAFKPYCDPQASGPCPPPWIYQYDSSGSLCGKNAICRSENGGNNDWVRLTASEVSIQSMAFYVIGTTRGDPIQPKVLIVVKGQAGTLSGKTQTTFHIEAAAVQRQLDLK